MEDYFKNEDFEKEFINVNECYNLKKLAYEINKVVIPRFIPSDKILEILKLNGFEFEPLTCRKKELVLNRHIACFFMKKGTKDSLTKIGSYFNKDHATVLHSIKVVNNLCFSDKKFNEKVENVEKLLIS